MKKLLSLALALTSLSALASTPDTISVNNSLITKTIIDNTTNSKGNPTKKYYIIYDNQLVGTNKTTIEHIALCNKYNVNCALILITSKTGRKRIVLN